MFAFLRASPLVEIKDDNTFVPLDPDVRRASIFRNKIKENFSGLKNGLKGYFNVLTRDNLKTALSKHCTILHLTSDHYEKDFISFEGEIGELDNRPLIDFHAEFRENIRYGK